MGRGEKPGTLTLVPGWQNMENTNDPGEKLSVSWPATENNAVFADILSQVSYPISLCHLPNVLSRYSDTAVFCSSM
jgi:hypothetical protein